MPARYTLVIGTANWSSWSLRPYLALSHLGVAFHCRTIRLRQPGAKAAMLKQSPAGKVPVLKITERGKTVTVWDSLAICETLAERHPKAGLWPANAAARATARAYAAEMHAGFPNLREQLSMDFARTLPLPDLRESTQTEIARIQAAWEAALKVHAKNPGGPFLFGRFSLADVMYAPVVSRFITYGVETSPSVSAYMARVMALPGMIAWGRMAQRDVRRGIA